VRLAYVIASKNDGFCGDPMSRLLKTLRQILYGPGDCEVIVSDWASDQPIVDVIGGELPKTKRARFLYIPKEVSGEFPVPFVEVVALNAAVRRAHGTLVGRLDQDTLVGPRFVKWVHEHPLDDRRAFFSTRRDLPPGCTWIDASAPIWHDFHPDSKWFYAGAVGILLAPRAEWHATRGYDERLQFRDHMEHDLCLRFRRAGGLVNLTPIIKADFYHLWHERIPGLPVNPSPHPEQLEEQIIPTPNDDNWGLGGIELHEVVV
jgi:hypothetical protein